MLLYNPHKKQNQKKNSLIITQAHSNRPQLGQLIGNLFDDHASNAHTNETYKCHIEFIAQDQFQIVAN